MKFYVHPDDRRQCRSSIPEDQFFVLYQPLLLAIANTRFGRDLLCIPKEYPRIVHMRKNCVHALQADGSILADVRVGAKWANVIRSRFSAFQSYVRYFQANACLIDLPASSGLKAARALSCTSLTAYPDPDPETTTCDGSCFGFDDTATFSTIRSEAGFGSDDTQPFDEVATVQDSKTANFRAITRGIFKFDTSSIGAGQVISAAVLSLYGKDKTDTLAATTDINIYATTTASNTSLTSSDYNIANWTFTQCSTTIAYASWSTAGYNDFTLNATGIATISTSGVTTFGTASAKYDEINSSPVAINGGVNHISQLRAYFADQAGTGNDPQLVVTYASTAANTRSPGGGVSYGSFPSY